MSPRAATTTRSAASTRTAAATRGTATASRVLVNSDVVWSHLAGTSAANSVLTKTGAPGWDGWGDSTLALRSGSGWVEIAVQQNSLARMFGLAPTSERGPSFGGITFAWYLQQNAQALIYESGAPTGAFVALYSTGDRMRVAVEGGAVVYRQNGTLIYTSLVAPTYPLELGASIYDTGATVGPTWLGGLWT